MMEETLASECVRLQQGVDSGSLRHNNLQRSFLRAESKDPRSGLIMEETLVYA